MIHLLNNILCLVISKFKGIGWEFRLSVRKKAKIECCPDVVSGHYNWLISIRNDSLDYIEEGSLVDYIEEGSLVKNSAAMQETQFDSWVEKIPWRRYRLLTSVFLGFPYGSAGKESACNVGDLGSIPGLGRSPGEGKGYPLQYSGLENSMDCIIHAVAKSRIGLSDFCFHSLRLYWGIGQMT